MPPKLRERTLEYVDNVIAERDAAIARATEAEEERDAALRKAADEREFTDHAKKALDDTIRNLERAAEMEGGKQAKELVTGMGKLATAHLNLRTAVEGALVNVGALQGPVTTREAIKRQLEDGLKKSRI